MQKKFKSVLKRLTTIIKSLFCLEYTNFTCESYVAFCDSVLFHKKFCKQGFSHVIVFREDEVESKMNLIDLRSNYPLITIEEMIFNEYQRKIGLSRSSKALIKHLLDKDYKILRARVRISKSIWDIFNLKPMNCVTLAKYHCGIRGFAYTPYQLYKLIKFKKHACIIDSEEINMGDFFAPKADDSLLAEQKKQEDEEAAEKKKAAQEAVDRERAASSGGLGPANAAPGKNQTLG